jgi:hypothetical protein
LLNKLYAPSETEPQYLKFSPALSNPYDYESNRSNTTVDSDNMPYQDGDKTKLNIARRLILSSVYSLEDIASIVDIDIEKLKSMKQ